MKLKVGLAVEFFSNYTIHVRICVPIVAYFENSLQ